MAANKENFDLLEKLENLSIFRLCKFIENHITTNLMEGGIETRPANSNGLWSCILLPTILVLYSLGYNVSLLYKIMACLSVGMLFYCILFSIFLSVSCMVLKDNIYGGCVASSFISAILMYTVLDQELWFSVVYSMLIMHIFSLLLRNALTKFPKTFTIGEAMIVVQGITLFLVMTCFRAYYKIGDKSDEQMEFVYSVNFTILTTVGIIVIALTLMEESERNLKSLSYVVSIAGTYALVMLHMLVGVDCIIKLASYILLDVKKVGLFSIWLLMSIFAGFVIYFRTRIQAKASTVTRKSFHILASVVFLTGIIYDVHLITLAAGFGLGLLIFVETLRKADIDPISPQLQAAFDVYSDEKDVGYFAMTPVYLYVGLACPLILVPVHTGHQLELLSGVLSIGVGDTAASWFGSKYGFNKWSDGHKSLQGTSFNIISQIAVVYVLEMFEIFAVPNGLFKIMFVGTVTGLVEAKTDQIDNLILPLVTVIAFQIVGMFI
ncbi:dolichol kinase [Anticarsia gemmatalis]|uniref:dolichol kinase n=1 Tax=Anticarsia gemmatalis TaxID=129554 RepID=UPI003F75AE0F